LPDKYFRKVLRILTYLDERDHMRTFRNLIIQHTAVVILIRVEADDKFAVFLPDTLEYTDFSYGTQNKLFRS
jgi:hypothetical protein